MGRNSVSLLFAHGQIEIAVLSEMLCSEVGAEAAGLPVPDFPCFVSGGVFLNRMRTHKGNRAWMPDLARFGMDADRGRPAACGNLSHSV